MPSCIIPSYASTSYYQPLQKFRKISFQQSEHDQQQYFLQSIVNKKDLHNKKQKQQNQEVNGWDSNNFINILHQNINQQEKSNEFNQNNKKRYKTTTKNISIKNDLLNRRQYIQKLEQKLNQLVTVNNKIDKKPFQQKIINNDHHSTSQSQKNIVKFNSITDNLITQFNFKIRKNKLMLPYSKFLDDRLNLTDQNVKNIDGFYSSRQKSYEIPMISYPMIEQTRRKSFKKKFKINLFNQPVNINQINMKNNNEGKTNVKLRYKNNKKHTSYSFWKQQKQIKQPIKK